MKKVDNQSYNRIIEYLNEMDDIDENEKRYLMYYASQLYKKNIENIEKETVTDIFEALKNYNESLKDCVYNSITIKRINDVLGILQKISSSTLDEETIKEVSYEIDKLYCSSDLPVRANSSLSYNLQKRVERKR